VIRAYENIRVNCDEFNFRIKQDFDDLYVNILYEMYINLRMKSNLEGINDMKRNQKGRNAVPQHN